MSKVIKPKKGDIIKAVYKRNGVIQKVVDLGTVKTVAKDGKTFTDESGNTRQFNYDAENGVVLTGFNRPTKEEAPTAEESVEETPEEDPAAE